VRTITVPAMAVIVGKANWWPSKTFGAKTENVRERPTIGEDAVDEQDAVDKRVDWVDAT
jgi:putative drug exporter of the RND superfamily